MTLFKRLIRFRLLYAALTILVSVLSMTLTLWWNALLSGIINDVYSGIAVKSQYVIQAAAVMLLMSLSAFGLHLLTGWTAETLAHDLRMGYGAYFLSLSYESITQMNAGEQASKLQNEIGDVSVFLRTNLFPIADDCIKFIATFSFMLALNPALTLISNAPTFLILIYTFYSSRAIGEAASKTQRANALMNGFADTLVTVFPVMRLFDAAPLISGLYQTSLSRWTDAVIVEERRKSFLMSLSAMLSCLPLLLLFYIGGTQVMRGITAVGTLYIFINLSGNVSGVMMNMPGRIAALRRFGANMKRLEPFILLQGRHANGHTH